VIAFVLALTLVLLTTVFRSLVLAALTVVLNLLSVGAAYGLIVLVFQQGIGAGLLGFQQTDTIEALVPLVPAGWLGWLPRLQIEAPRPAWSEVA
jgi:putative drug exporter of the RND superfamily